MYLQGKENNQTKNKEDKKMTEKRYVVAWNTGDDYWDNEPDYDHYDTITEIEDAIDRKLTTEEIKDIENGFTVYDEFEVEYYVRLTSVEESY